MPMEKFPLVKDGNDRFHGIPPHEAARKKAQEAHERIRQQHQRVPKPPHMDPRNMRGL